MPEFFKAGMNKIARLNRSLSRKEMGSNNRHKARHQLGKAHDKIKNQRREEHFKLAHQLCDCYDVMFFEDLNMAGMKKLWGRKVSDLGFAEFMHILQWVAMKRGKQVLFIGRWEPTSKVCSDCGRGQALTLADRWFDCPACELSLDRDHNAARNILRVGTTTHDLEDVRRAYPPSLPEVKNPLPLGMGS
jgi:putative transposase